MNRIDLYNMDCRDAMSLFLPDNSVDAIVCDPPYGLAFMGKKWDYDVPGVDIWSECLRVLKPGGHLLAFAGTRTQHRMTVRIEDAGFEIRDMIAWVYGSGFPKSLDVSKAIDKAAGAERDVVGSGKGRTGKAAQPNGGSTFSDDAYKWPGVFDITAPATEAARQWEGWGTALKPALEPITMARKPLIGTVAANVLEHGTGALNIDGCRVGVSVDDDIHAKNPNTKGGFGHAGASVYGTSVGAPAYDPSAGRWPANLIHDGSGEVVAGFPDSNGSGAARTLNRSAKPDQQGWGMNTTGADATELRDAGSGSAARFFYCAKANKKDRGDGNGHPTVKPTDLMAYLCRLVTPPGGVVFDPFMGSGSTGKAALREGFGFIGCEMDAAYFAIAQARLAAVKVAA